MMDNEVHELRGDIVSWFLQMGRNIMSQNRALCMCYLFFAGGGLLCIGNY